MKKTKGNMMHCSPFFFETQLWLLYDGYVTVSACISMLSPLNDSSFPNSRVAESKCKPSNLASYLVTADMSSLMTLGFSLKDMLCFDK